MREDTMSIALLTQAGESGRHLRDALVESGNPVVYESQAADFDRDALEKSGARVVVVNLDSETDAHLDDIYALLDDERYNVIFNEAQVSSQLSGWEQARWARHLVAKILGDENSDPPRPEGAEPVPPPAAKIIPNSTPALAADVIAEDEFVDETLPQGQGSIEVIEISDPAVALAEQSVNVEYDEDPFADIAALLVESEADPLETFVSKPAASTPRPYSVDDTVPMPALDLSEFDDFADESMPELSFGDEQPMASTAEVDLIDVDETIEMAAFDVSADHSDATLGFGDLDDFADADETSIESIEIASEPVPDSVSLDSELAGSIEAAESAATGSELSGLQLLDLDLTDPAEKPSGEKAELSDEEVKIPELGSAFDWSLASLDVEEGETAGDGKATTGKASFGIETISAAEYLTPEADTVADDSIEAEMSLELIPIEEAVAHHAAGNAKSGSTTSESWLDTENKVVITRVWVLGASIGGPEAVREFLADIPAKFPALFLLAQHMGAEFMEIMAQQLVRSTNLTVRTPSHGERVSHGDIVIVPTTHRLRVDRAGVITLEAQSSSDRPNSPSIDQVLQDVADRFGGQAGAIIFSGMAEDAAEGSRYLTEIGGTVYAQDPETCVISSMVDGVIETGVVSFVGSPKALAGKLLSELSASAKT
ncbi:MAG: chemotaxis protein CheB [Dokdonella sp.]